MFNRFLFIKNLAYILEYGSYDNFTLYDDFHRVTVNVGEKRIKKLLNTINDLLPFVDFMNECYVNDSVRITLKNGNKDIDLPVYSSKDAPNDCEYLSKILHVSEEINSNKKLKTFVDKFTELTKNSDSKEDDKFDKLDDVDYDDEYNECNVDDGEYDGDCDRCEKNCDECDGECDKCEKNCNEIDEFDDDCYEDDENYDEKCFEDCDDNDEELDCDDNDEKLNYDEGDEELNYDDYSFSAFCEKCENKDSCADYLISKNKIDSLSLENEKSYSDELLENSEDFDDEYFDDDDDYDEDDDDDYALKLILVDREIEIESIACYELKKPIKFNVDLFPKFDMWFWQNEELGLSCIGKSYSDCIDEIERTIACMIFCNEYPDELLEYIDPDEFMDINDWSH